ncbi:unnamed protein product [Rotaria sp. Silwood1]|nr:unnamed protein product [Rotaria sp. Silwood1]
MENKFVLRVSNMSKFSATNLTDFMKKSEADGVFNDNDFFDFYGTRNKGGLTNYLNGFTNTVSYTKDEYNNNYSDTSVYWIDWGGTNGVRMQDIASSNSFPSFPNPYFFESIHTEYDNVYTLGETPSADDYRHFNPELVDGEGWFWNDLAHLYSGHAGNGTWDNGLENPDLLSNGLKLPLVFSMTCFTGKNAINEFRGFGEKFIYLPNKGAIGYVGNTGWTFSGNGQALNRRFLDALKGGWSTIQRLIYNPSGTFARTSEAVDSVGSGFTLPLGSAPLRVLAHGNNGEEASEFTFNGGVLRIDNRSLSGLVMMIVNKLTGRFLEIKQFTINSSASSDSIVTYLNGIDSNKYVLMSTVQLFESDSLRDNAKNKIREFGSIMIDSVKGRTFQTWAFIGRKGASPSECGEDYHPNNTKNSCPDNWCTSVCAITRDFQTINGTLTQNFGPAKSWKNFNAFANVPSFTSIKYNVFGKTATDQNILLYSNVGPSFSFDTLNALTYPNISITSAFNLDSLQGVTPPSLKSFVLNYVPPVELAVDNYSFTRSDTGDSVTIYHEAVPAYAVNEFNSYNNTGITTIIVKSDSLKPLASITFDGQNITNGDFIQANPEIVIQLFDDSPIAIQGADTSTIKIKLDSKYVPYANNPDIQFIVARGIVLFQNAFAQNPNWITPGKTYLKMYVAQDAIYRINKTDFTTAGVDPSSIDPRTLKVFNKGNQIPVFFSGESDGVFDNADFFDFYGERNYGGSTKYYDENGAVQYSINEYYDLYSDTNVYWVDWGGAIGSRYSDYSYISGVNYANGNSLKMNLPTGDTTSKKFTINSVNTSAPVNIYDVRNNVRIVNGSYSSSDLVFTAKSDAKLEIINADITNKPLRIKQKSVPNLLTNGTGADYPLDDWAKRFILVTGGVSQSEQSYFQSISNIYGNTYLSPKPLAGGIDKIYRIDGQGGATYNFQDSIVNEFNRGALIINYSGHAGNGTWDQGLEDPNLLSNGLKLPMLFSMTCFTAKNSDPASRGFGEKFFIYADKGAIGYVGCTGWAFTNATNTLNTYLYGALKDSSARRQGDLLRIASSIMKNDSASFSSRISLECFNFLGDPAQKLMLPNFPEFSIKDNEYKISDQNPIQGQNVKLTAFPKNFGTAADSMKIRFQLLKNNLAYKSQDTVIRNFNFKDSASYNFSLDTLGIYFIRVTLDPDNWYTQEDPNNNVITVPVNLRNNSFVPLKPITNSIVNTDTVYFTCLNPDTDPLTNTMQLSLQLDTNSAFTNPIIFVNNSPIGVFSKFQTLIPVKDSSITYYWRTNATINGNISGWSQTQTFSYNTRAFAFNRRVKDNPPALDSSIVLYLKSKNQFDEASFNNVAYQSGGLSIPQSSGIMRCYSLGNNGEESSFFIVNGSQINIGQSLNPGLNILRVRRIDMKIQELKNFRFNSATSADSVANYLNGVDSSNYIMVVKALATTSNSMNAACKNAFRQFGSVYADSTPAFSSFWTWSFIGYKGANSSQISEDFHRNNSSNSCASNWCPSNSYLPEKYLKTFGTATVNLGPAQNWKKFSWDQITGPGNSVSIDVYGIKKDNSSTLLYPNVTINSGFNLDTLNTFTYPNLNLLVKFNLDTLAAAPSPVIKSLTAQYYPPYEVVVNKPSFYCKETSVKLGQKVKISFSFSNVGYKDINKFYVNWYYFPFGPGRKVLRADTLTTLVNIDSSYKVTQDIVIPRDNSPLVAPSNTTIYAEILPYGKSNEFYSYNNTGQITFRIIPVLTTASITDVYFDGIAVKNGDFVRKTPDVKIKLNDIGALFSPVEVLENEPITKNHIRNHSDSSNIKLYLNDQYLPYRSNSTAALIRTKGFETSSSDNIELNLTPQLIFGDNKLTILISDNSGDFYNYPNPVARETNFVFNIAAGTKPRDCKIKIYTVSDSKEEEATIADIEEDGSLKVVLSEGDIKNYYSGEITFVY